MVPALLLCASGLHAVGPKNSMPVRAIRYRSNVFGDDRACGDNSTFAYSYAAQDHCARANPRVIANLDWTLVERNLDWVALLEDLLNLLVARRRTKRVSQTIEDIRRVRNKDAIANLNESGRPDAA